MKMKNEDTFMLNEQYSEPYIELKISQDSDIEHMEFDEDIMHFLFENGEGDYLDDIDGYSMMIEIRITDI